MYPGEKEWSKAIFEDYHCNKQTPADFSTSLSLLSWKDQKIFLFFHEYPYTQEISVHESSVHTDIIEVVVLQTPTLRCTTKYSIRVLAQQILEILWTKQFTFLTLFRFLKPNEGRMIISVLHRNTDLVGQCF